MSGHTNWSACESNKFTEKHITAANEERKKNAKEKSIHRSMPLPV